VIKFLNDRSGYIKALEEEATPESFSRIENLKELANAAQDAQERGETHARVSRSRRARERCGSVLAEARVTLMTAPCCEGSGVSAGVSGWHGGGPLPQRADDDGSDRAGGGAAALLCRDDSRDGYAGDDAGALRRRRYGNDSPEASIPSRFLEEVPGHLVEDLGSPPARPQFSAYSTPYPQRGGLARPRRARKKASATTAMKMRTRAANRAGVRRRE